MDHQSDEGQHTNNKKRQRTFVKRPSSSWKDQPAFLDASASISVATFGARRLPELQQLYTPKCDTDDNIQAEHVALESGGGQTSSRHLRRRTTSHQSRRHRHRFPTTSTGSPPTKAATRTRKAKRSSKEILCQGHHQWLQCSDMASNTLHWMMTHVWHTKRFHMQTLWGWRVPVAHTNRGARAILRLTSRENKTTLQDLTFCRQPIRIQSTTNCKREEFVKCIARILPDWSTTNPRSLASTQMGEGILHHMDTFPRGAIGPTIWHMTHDTSSEQWNVDLRIHPSIRSSVLDCLKQLQSTHSSHLQCSTSILESPNTLCCFQICGINATRMVHDVLNPKPCSTLSKNECNWNTVLNESTPCLHGLIARVTVDTMSGENATTTNAILVRQLPRPLDCNSNRAVAGWDIYCSHQHALNIWRELALHCVIIGIVEQMHLQMECEPPIPVFPRDEIDFETSLQYWDGQETDWKFVRQLYEGGWGRLPIKRKVHLEKLSWDKLILGKTDGMDCNELQQNENCVREKPVVVRGAFGLPFLAVLEGCGQLVESIDENTQGGGHRRKRRRATSSRAVKKAQPLNSEHSERWHQMVQTLFDNLSLPAALKAHILVVGQGTIHVGDEILIEKTVAGIVTAGAFSPSRGAYHGVAILGAHKTLHALCAIDISKQHIGRIVPLANGSNQIQLSGSIHRSPDKYIEVAISLVL